MSPVISPLLTATFVPSDDDVMPSEASEPNPVWSVHVAPPFVEVKTSPGSWDAANLVPSDEEVMEFQFSTGAVEVAQVAPLLVEV